MQEAECPGSRPEKKNRAHLQPARQNAVRFRLVVFRSLHSHMSETIYCYHCRVHHPAPEMRQIETKSGKRWRCIKSIVAAKQGSEARAAFGRQTTDINRAEAQSKARIVLNNGRR